MSKQRDDGSYTLLAPAHGTGVFSIVTGKPECSCESSISKTGCSTNESAAMDGYSEVLSVSDHENLAKVRPLTFSTLPLTWLSNATRRWYGILYELRFEKAQTKTGRVFDSSKQQQYAV